MAGDITEEDVLKNRWTDPYAPGRDEGLRDEARELYENTEYAIAADIMCLGPFEGGCQVRGWEDFLTDFYLSPNLAEAVMDRFTETAIGLWDVFLSAVGEYVDVVCQGDDLAMQDRSLIPLDIYRKYILKYHKRIYDFIKTKTKAKIFHHSCGAVYELVPGLIEAGIDILQPLQTSARNMDTLKLKKEFGKDLVFWGGLDVQKVLQLGTPAEIDAEVKRVMETLGEGGGYVFGPGHNIQAGVPMENIDAMFRAAVKYRDY